MKAIYKVANAVDKAFTKSDLFGAESVGLWVIGIDFILVSLKRISAEMVQETNTNTDMRTGGTSLNPAF